MQTWQIVLSEKLEEFFSKWCTDDEEFSYSGGVAHNVVINEILNKKFPNMRIPPSIGDEGQSLGAMFAYLDLMSIEAPACPTTNWQSEEIPMMNDETISTVKDLIIADKIVAVCQVKVTLSPRALGNRSLIYRTNKKICRTLLQQAKTEEQRMVASIWYNCVRRRTIKSTTHKD